MIKLGDYDSPFGTISVLRKKSTGTIVYEQAGYFQSESDEDGISLAAYVHAIFGLILEANLRSILVIGGAGCTLGTMLARHGRNVTMVDINPISFSLAKLYFKLPDNIRCVVADGRDFLRSHASIYDAVVVDAYHGDRIPAHLQSLSFFRLARDRLSARGAVFKNIHIDDDSDITSDRLMECMANVWSNVRLLDTVGLCGRNAIAMAGAVEELHRPYLRMRPAADADLIDSELAMMRFRERNRRI